MSYSPCQKVKHKQLTEKNYEENEAICIFLNPTQLWGAWENITKGPHGGDSERISGGGCAGD